MEAALWELTEGDSDEEVEVIIRLHDPAVVPSGVRIVTQFGSIVTCRLPRRLIVDVRRDERVASVKAPAVITPEVETALSIDDVHEPTRESDHRRPRLERATGRGVVVASIDWGCDFTHPNFRHEDGRTRLLALWDQSAPYAPARPNRYGYGAIHSADDINRALMADRPDAALNYFWHRSDAARNGTHGTFVLDIAAGNGRVGMSGVAPGADLVFVHVVSRGLAEHANLGSSVTLLEALDFVLGTAGDRPVCVNTSLGRQAGPHDGSSLIEQAFDAALDLAPGRFIGQSTGNYYEGAAHASGRLRPGQIAVVPFVVSKTDITANEVEVWYAGRDVMLAQVRSPTGETSRKTPPDDETTIRDGSRVVCRIYHRAREPNNLDNTIHVYVYAGAPAGRWELILTGEDVVDGRFDAWIERDAACFGCQAHFEASTAVPLSTTGTICNGFRSVAVGAYDAHDPARPLAPFSSSGPTRDGRIKPDLVAPGVRVLAAQSATDRPNDQSARLTRKSGTSMAAPHVTGLVALMFELAGRRLTIQETRNLLLTSTSHADVAGNQKHRIGSGYLDMDAALVNTRRHVEREHAAISGQERTHMTTTSSPLGREDTARDGRELEVAAQSILEQDDAPQTGRQVNVTLGYGVPNGRITDPFYRDADEKLRTSGRRHGRARHPAIDVSTSNATGGDATDPRRGLPVYAVIRPAIDLSELQNVRAVGRNGNSRTGVSVRGVGIAQLDHAVVLAQPWSSQEGGAYGGVLGLACRYGYPNDDGAVGTFTLYLEYLHLITPAFLPKDGTGRVISAEDWAATGKGIGFGPRMQNGERLTAADLTAAAPLLIGYLGATQFPHVHIQAAYGAGERRYLRSPRFDPAIALLASATTTASSAGAEVAPPSELIFDLEEEHGPFVGGGDARVSLTSDHDQWMGQNDAADRGHYVCQENTRHVASTVDATGECDFGLSVVEAAESALDADASEQSTCHYFRCILNRVMRASAGANLTRTISPVEVLRAFLRTSGPSPTLMQFFRVVARPGRPPSGQIGPGDVLLRRIPDDGYVHVAIVGSDDVLERDRAVASGWRLESHRPGFYAVVVEAGSRPHRRAARFARRILDPRGNGFPNTLVLRVRGRGPSELQPRSTLSVSGLAEQAQHCGFFGPGGVVSEVDLRNEIVRVGQAERHFWQAPGTGNPIAQGDDDQFPHLVRYWLSRLSSIPPSTLLALHASAISGRVNYGPLLHAAAPNVPTAAQLEAVRTDLLLGAPSAWYPNNLDTLIDDALRRAIGSRRATHGYAWSAVFVVSCIRLAAITLILEADAGGFHEGKDVLLLGLDEPHRYPHLRYVREALSRTQANQGGTYHAFDVGHRPVRRGDVIVQDRQSGTLANVMGFNQIPAIGGRNLHGDIVVDVVLDAHPPHALAVGGNLGRSVRLRRYPLDVNGHLVVAFHQKYRQQRNDGLLLALPSVHAGANLHVLSTARIFALLSPVELCVQNGAIGSLTTPSLPTGSRTTPSRTRLTRMRS